MFLDPYFSESGGIVTIEAEQASRFAKRVGKDFNPIHDPDAKRFCIPGDLLFSLVLTQFGLSQKMFFQFAGMAGHNVKLKFEEVNENLIRMTDGQGKLILEVTRYGETTHDSKLIEGFIRNYVGFSGQNFPTLMLPLMAEHQVMFNPDRPLIMYNSMGFDLDTFDLSGIKVELSGNDFDNHGKRADHLIQFDFLLGDHRIGHGTKKLIIGGLKPYCEEMIHTLVARYEDRRSNFISNVA